MPNSTQLALRPSASNDSRSLDHDEAQLASAEKELKIILATCASDYDKLITVASDALQTTSKASSKAVIKSRKKLYWFRSTAYYNKGLKDLALKDAKAALKLDPRDIGSCTRAAAMLLKTGYEAQARSCFDMATTLAERCAKSERMMWLRKIDTTRERLSVSLPRHMERLPNEVLVQIAQHLPGSRRATMSQVCCHWRQLLTSAPFLWEEMIIRFDFKHISESKVFRWLQHIRSHSIRANNALKRVEFYGFFPRLLIYEVLYILRESASSLQHIRMPALTDGRCYDALYKYCPNLKSLEWNFMSPINDNLFRPSARLKAERNNSPDPPPVPDRPFSLADFRCDELVAHPDLSRHILGARVLHNYHPSLPQIRPEREEEFRGKEANVLISLADTLEEWVVYGDWPCSYLFSPNNNFPPVTATFARLRVLRNFRVNSKLKFSFPVLEELTLEVSNNPDDVDDQIESEFVRMLDSSPNLKTLSVYLCDININDPEISRAMRSLSHLEELDISVDCERKDRFLSSLICPYEVLNGSGQRKVEFPYPNLRRLEINARTEYIGYTCMALIIRDQMRRGSGLREAGRVAYDCLMSTNFNSSAAASPFQRGERVNSWTETPKTTLPPQDSVADHASICRLESLRLEGLTALKPNIEIALRRLVPELELDYDPL